ncbi:hypothetical protein D3C71_1241040 [compost metagenome]
MSNPICTVIGKQIDFTDRLRFRAIIGSTKASELEKKMAFELGRRSVQEGYIVVSGLAKGIDTEAHKGALSVEGDFAKTVAVVSTGTTEGVYPHENYDLAEDIKLNGALIHCYKTIAPWTKENFGPKQKRLVERDTIQAYVSEEIIVVSDKDNISGGTRWALNYGKLLGKTLICYDSQGNRNDNFTFKEEKALIWWKMELDWMTAGEQLLNNHYTFWEVRK